MVNLQMFLSCKTSLRDLRALRGESSVLNLLIQFKIQHS